jgi:hypothetical protein
LLLMHIGLLVRLAPTVTRGYVVSVAAGMVLGLNVAVGVVGAWQRKWWVTIAGAVTMWVTPAAVGMICEMISQGTFRLVRDWHLMLPVLCFSLMLAGAAHGLARIAIRSRERRSGPPRCPECDYNLTGNVSGVCPECGTPITPPHEPGEEPPGE